MKKLLFSRNSNKPSAPSIGSFEGQELFSLKNLQPTLTSCTAQQYTVESPVHGVQISSDNKGISTSPITYGVSLIGSSYPFKATYSLPILNKKSYTVGAAFSQNSEYGNMGFCWDNTGKSPGFLARYVRINNMDYDGVADVHKEGTNKVIVYDINGNIVSRGSQTSHITASTSNWNVPGDSNQKDSFVSVDLKRLTPIGSVDLYRTWAMKIPHPSVYYQLSSCWLSAGDTQAIVYDYNPDASEAECRSQDYSYYTTLNDGTAIYRKAINVAALNIHPTYQYSPGRADEFYSYEIYKFSRTRSDSDISYIKESGVLGENMSLIDFYPEDNSSYTLFKCFGTDIVIGDSGDFIDPNELPISQRRLDYNLFAYEGEEWFDFYRQDWRRGNKLWVCEVEYDDSTGVITSVGTVHLFTKEDTGDTDYVIIKEYQANIIYDAFESGGHRRIIDAAPASRASIDEKITSNKITISFKPISYTSTFPTFDSSSLNTGEKILQKHLDELSTFSEDLRGGAACSSGCTGICVSTCSGTCKTGCTGTCLGDCSNICGNSCTKNCGGSCYIYCTAGGCESTCFGSCSGSGCSKTCAGNCENACAGCTGCTGSCTDNCSGCGANSSWCLAGCEWGACTSYCRGGCKGSNASSCSNYCGNSCSDNCGQSNCSSGCKNSCSGDCTISCSNGCSRECRFGCADSCSENCTTSCDVGCITGCSNYCSGGCSYSSSDAPVKGK